MKLEKKKILEVAGKLVSPFRSGSSNRPNAIGLSILLHVVVVAAIASFWATTVTMIPADQPTSIEFDLVAEQTPPAVASSQSAKAQSQAGKAGGGERGQVTQSPKSREAVLMASLAGLTELKESLGFVSQPVASDSSSSAFAPMGSGSAPNTSLDALGKKYGGGSEGTGGGGFTVSVGGVCISPTPN